MNEWTILSSRSNLWKTGGAILVLLLVGACDPNGGGSEDDTDDTGDSADDTGDSANDTDSNDTDSGNDTEPTTPFVLSTTPLDGANNVHLDGNASATFSEPMDGTTIIGTTFTVTTGDPPVAVQGEVVYANSTAVFWPDSSLPINTTFTATITTDAQSFHHVAMADDYVWTFATGDAIVAALPVYLGTASNFAILAKSGISTVPASAITGDIGVSPAAATYITGFSLIADSTQTFSTSTQVTGQVFAANYAVPTPSNMTTAIGDMQLAFTRAAGRAPDFTELGAGDIGGMTLAPGVYKWGTGLLIPTDVTLAGSATGVWIFQIAQDLTLSSGVEVKLTGGAVPERVFWQVAGKVDLGTTSHLEGIVLTQTAIALRTGASVDGRLLAQTAVTLDHATVIEPIP